MVDLTFDSSTFKNSDLINMEFINVNFESSYFENCGFGNAVFELCHFLKPIFEGVKGGPLGSAVLIDSKFSNSNKSIKFEGEVYFNDIFDQIDKFYIN